MKQTIHRWKQKLGSEGAQLLILQLATPAIRIIFVFWIVSLHPNTAKCLTILASAELLSAFMVLGRSYLIQGGLSPSLFNNKLLNFGVIIGTTVIASVALQWGRGNDLMLSVLFLASMITICTMDMAYALRGRKVVRLLVVNLMIYVLAFVAPYLTDWVISSVSIIAMIVYGLARDKGEFKDGDHRYIPAASNTISFATQRIDVQIASLVGGSFPLVGIFQYATLLMPIALIARLISNIALIRGHESGLVYLTSVPVLFAAGLAYSLFIYTIGWATQNEFIIQNVALLSLVPPISLLMMPYREKIGVMSSKGNFFPLLGLAIAGLVPVFITWVYVSLGFALGISAFILTVYILPRVIMLVFSANLFRNKLTEV